MNRGEAQTTEPTSAALAPGDIASLDVAPTSFEPCATFRPQACDSPVCEECGWLLHEHADDSVPTTAKGSHAEAA